MHLATDLAAPKVESTTAELAWKAPKGSTVRLRRTTGTSGAKSVTAGVAVRISRKDLAKRSATDHGLNPGGAYTYTLFDEGARHHWARALSITITTRSPGASAYVLKPDTVLATPAQAAASHVRPGADGVAGVLVFHSGGATPPIGAAVVLPDSTATPGGFLGQVAAIEPNGDADLTPGTLADVYDYLDATVDLSTLPSSESGVAANTMAPEKAEDSSASCSVSKGVEKIGVSPKWGGSFHADVTTNRWHIPNGGNVHISVNPTFTTTIQTNTAVSCGWSVEESLPFTLGAVPVVIATEFGISATVGGAQTVTHQVTLGAYGDASLSGRHLSISGDKIFQPSSISTTNETSISVQADAALSVGPGIEVNGLGAKVGFKLDDTLAKLSLTQEGNSACGSLDLKSAIDASLTAKVWLGPVAAEDEASIYNHDVPWSGYPKPIGTCGPSTPTPTPTTLPTASPTVEPTGSPTPPTGQYQLTPVTASSSNQTAYVAGLSADGSRVLIGVDQGSSRILQVANTADVSHRVTLTEASDGLRSAALSPSGNSVYFTSSNPVFQGSENSPSLAKFDIDTGSYSIVSDYHGDVVDSFDILDISNDYILMDSNNITGQCSSGCLVAFNLQTGVSYYLPRQAADEDCAFYYDDHDLATGLAEVDNQLRVAGEKLCEGPDDTYQESVGYTVADTNVFSAIDNAEGTRDEDDYPVPGSDVIGSASISRDGSRLAYAHWTVGPNRQSEDERIYEWNEADQATIEVSPIIPDKSGNAAATSGIEDFLLSGDGEQLVLWGVWGSSDNPYSNSDIFVSPTRSNAMATAVSFEAAQGDNLNDDCEDFVSDDVSDVIGFTCADGRSFIARRLS